MAVDFARKAREQQGKVWALRNAKLRMSRKLIFASGLLTCLNCEEVKRTSEGGLPGYLYHEFRRKPLDNLAKAVLETDQLEAGRLIFGAYNRFLAILADGSEREHLKKLTPREVKSDELFGAIRNISHDFQKGLTRLFFESKLKDRTIKYGVF